MSDDPYANFEFRDYMWVFRAAQHVAYLDPQRALPQMMSARNAAQKADDKQAVLYMNHWLVQVMIFSAEDLTSALDLAIETAIEARKPLYADMRERLGAQTNLLAAYLAMDPLGYAPMIEEAIAYTRREGGDNPEHLRVLLQIECGFELAKGQVDRAQEVANRYIATSQDNDPISQFHTAIAMMFAAIVAYRKGDWKRMAWAGQQGATLEANQADLVKERCASMVAWAVALQRMGQADAADLQIRRAEAEAALTYATHNTPFYDLITDYYEHDGDLHTALHYRQQQIKGLTNKGQHYWESLARLEALRLAKATGQALSDANRQAAHACIQRLKAPQMLLMRLNKL